MIYATEQQVVVTAVLIVAVGLIAMFLGMWWGVGRGLEQAKEEQRWEREEAKTRRTHPVYRHPPELAHEDEGISPALAVALARDRTLGGNLHDIHGGPGEDCWCGYIGHESVWLPPDETVLNPTAVLSPPVDLSWTGEIQRMTAAFERDMERLLGGTDEQLRGITR